MRCRSGRTSSWTGCLMERCRRRSTTRRTPLSRIFAKGDPDRRKTLLRVVASNVTLRDGKAHLNLKPAFAILSKTGTHSKWLPIVKDVRTALHQDPLPIETMRELLSPV